MSMHTDPPPLAPDDKPFDWDEEEPKPLFHRPWWIVATVLFVIALLAGLASPIIAFW